MHSRVWTALPYSGPWIRWGRSRGWGPENPSPDPPVPDPGRVLRSLQLQSCTWEMSGAPWTAGSSGWQGARRRSFDSEGLGEGRELAFPASSRVRSSVPQAGAPPVAGQSRAARCPIGAGASRPARQVAPPAPRHWAAAGGPSRIGPGGGPASPSLAAGATARPGTARPADWPPAPPRSAMFGHRPPAPRPPPPPPSDGPALRAPSCRPTRRGSSVEFRGVGRAGPEPSVLSGAFRVPPPPHLAPPPRAMAGAPGAQR